MIIDLARQETEPICCADFVVVGAGIAGLILAARLRRKGARVVVLESGGREQRPETDSLNRAVQLGTPYQGASDGRSRCLGGTSTRWGGALIPFLEHDLAARPYLGLPSFPIGLDAIRGYLADVEAIFGVDASSYEEDVVRQIQATGQVPIGDPDFIVRFAKWPRFKHRNVAVLFQQLLERDPELEVWINATVTNFKIDTASGRIISVLARHQGDRKLSAVGRHYIICAGAIESTRLLLLLDREYDQRIFRNCSALGHFFYDHVSLPMANIEATRVITLNRLAAFRFIGSTMRSLRFELSPSAQARERTASAFGHISFRPQRRTGFDTLRDLLRARQRTGRLPLELVMNLILDVPYLARLCLWRILYNQLLWPAPATYELHVVAEQLPLSSNYLTLATEKDQFGLPAVAINWRVGNEERRTFNAYMQCFDRYWVRSGLDAIGRLNWTYCADSQSSNSSNMYADVYHPGGSTRMGTDRHTAVVDANFRSFAVENLWVMSTSAFPSGGGANPTLTLMLFAMRLADHLSHKLRTAAPAHAVA